MTEEYLGPCSLTEALDGAEPSGNVRMAVSIPYGDLVAVQVGKQKPLIRQAERKSGHGGSVLDTGRWVPVDELAPTILWRPA